MLRMKVFNSTILELQGEAELGVAVFNSQELPGTSVFMLLSDGPLL